MGFTRRAFVGFPGRGAAGGRGSLPVALVDQAPVPGAHLGPAPVPNYRADIAGAILAGLKELGILPGEIRGKRILLKPNLVEGYAGASHINTHPLVVRGAAEAFRRLGAAQVLVAEGPGAVWIPSGCWRNPV